MISFDFPKTFISKSNDPPILWFYLFILSSVLKCTQLFHRLASNTPLNLSTKLHFRLFNILMWTAVVLISCLIPPSIWIILVIQKEGRKAVLIITVVNWKNQNINGFFIASYVGLVISVLTLLKLISFLLLVSHFWFLWNFLQMEKSQNLLNDLFLPP